MFCHVAAAVAAIADATAADALAIYTACMSKLTNHRLGENSSWLAGEGKCMSMQS